VHFYKATIPFGARPRALFVILITRTMSLASAPRMRVYAARADRFYLRANLLC